MRPTAKLSTGPARRQDTTDARRPGTGSGSLLPESVREAALAAVGEDDHDRAWRRFASGAQRRDKGGAGRHAHQEALLSSESPGHLVRLLRRDLLAPAGERRLEDGRDDGRGHVLQTLDPVEPVV